jgi:hypothetical protein
MKLCESHWHQLQDRIRERGLWDRVARSGEELSQRAGTKNPCPLLEAAQAIVRNAIGYCQHHDRPLPDDCPVCELDVEDWLALAADDEADARCASCLKLLPDEDADDELCGLCQHLGGRSRARPH